MHLAFTQILDSLHMKNLLDQVRPIVMLVTLLGVFTIHVTAQDKQERQLSSFDRVLVSNAITLQISPGEKQLVKVEATSTDQDKIITEVVNHTLIIRRDNTRKREFKGGTVTVYVTLKSLKGLEANSASKIIGQAPFKTIDFFLTVHEASSANLHLTAQTVSVDMSGASRATLQLDTKELKGNLSQASQLTYKGNSGKQTVQTIEASSVKQI